MKKETKIALQFLSKRSEVMSEYWSHVEYYDKLQSYILNKGEEALQALAGFYLYAIDKIEDAEKRSRMLTSTFAHDLGQQTDEWMLPRSSGYLDYFKEEIETGKKVLKHKD